VLYCVICNLKWAFLGLSKKKSRQIQFHIKNNKKYYVKYKQLIVVKLALISISLQDFKVLPTDIFCRYEIQSLTVIFLPTKSPTENICQLTVRR
jgi:hypothetical protein